MKIKARKKKSKKDRMIDYVKIVMHAEYNYELQKFYHHKRYLKEQKKFKKKRNRQKLKQELRKINF